MQTKTQTTIKKKLVEAATPFGASDMNLRVTSKEIRVVTGTEFAMKGVCRKLKESTDLMGKVRVGDDGLRTVVLRPVDNEGVKMFKDFVTEFGDVR